MGLHIKSQPKKYTGIFVVYIVLEFNLEKNFVQHVGFFIGTATQHSPGVPPFGVHIYQFIHIRVSKVMYAWDQAYTNRRAVVVQNFTQAKLKGTLK